MILVDSLDSERWNEFVRRHPKGSIFHTPHMMDVFRSARHHQPMFLAALDNSGEILALLASVRVQTLPEPFGRFASRSIFYAQPICSDNADGSRALAAIVAEHDRRMKSRVLFTEVRPLAAPGPEANAFAASGYDYEPYLNFLVDLRQPE